MPYKAYVNFVYISKLECGPHCKCKPGSVIDGGKEVNEHGYCEFYCSTYGHCGDGTQFKTGTDCTACKMSGKKLVVWWQLLI